MDTSSDSNRPPIREVVLSEVDGAPRTRDLDLADRLGFARPRVIRELISRNKAELEGFGPLAVRHGKSRGQEFAEYWLNEEQALLIAVKSEAERAAEVRAMLIRVFVAWRRGELEAAPARTSMQMPHAAREARLFMKHAMALAKIGGLMGNQMLIAANRATRKAVGFDYLDAMGMSQIAAPDNDVLITPTDIGQRLGAVSAVRVNHLLAENGFQTGEKDSKGRGFWLPTEKGIAAGAQMVDVERSNKTGQARQLRWPTRIVDLLRQIIEDAA